MAPRHEKSQLKRGHPSAGDHGQDPKKARHTKKTQAVAAAPTVAQQPLPVTQSESMNTEYVNEGTVSPPDGEQGPAHVRSPVQYDSVTSPPSDTQQLSQFVIPPQSISHEVEDEEAEGVWGYLVPIASSQYEPSVVLKKRAACTVVLPNATSSRQTRSAAKGKGKERAKGKQNDPVKPKGSPSTGYIIGRHPECDIVVQNDPTISNRHALLFVEQFDGNSVAFVEDLSSNGTFVNDAIVGRNKRRDLQEGDEISIVNLKRFIFRYPRNRKTSAFHQQYTLGDQLGQGHFATVYLCVEKSTGERYAVKVFTQRKGVDERTRNESLQQEIAVLMSLGHPNLLCLKDTFAEENRVYLVLELAPEGELFNWIISHNKLTEDETRHVFIQLFHGLKYLHDRDIVHRDIKPENILMVNSSLAVKIADFGLAKIIGEDSFTTTLCGTPSYVAPEIINKGDRRYTRAVDIWSLGVVLYICLCGFPPFSDELNRPDYPYDLLEQIRRGIFDFPSPYWDDIDDHAMDLIDKMLSVDADERLTVDECLHHPWITQKSGGNSQNPDINPTDSIDGLTPAMNNLDFSKRKIARTRTLLSQFNKVAVSKEIDATPKDLTVKIFQRNADHHVNKSPVETAQVTREHTPGALRAPEEFMQMGGKGDQVLFDEEGSKYEPTSDMVGLITGKTI
ncbi:hypothetical protein FGG08_002188 [Glutinoglossum americanum]|uniref:Uncharacterized protein n=1 Tax=Glutinoglossum americanum TaxID=1670608 RepID=A0A9P8L5T3_9PEZI|nr:hypothetical protein FGG08_002188 [Glutinoglossum americanum]